MQRSARLRGCTSSTGCFSPPGWSCEGLVGAGRAAPARAALHCAWRDARAHRIRGLDRRRLRRGLPAAVVRHGGRGGVCWRIGRCGWHLGPPFPAANDGRHRLARPARRNAGGEARDRTGAARSRRATPRRSAAQVARRERCGRGFSERAAQRARTCGVGAGSASSDGRRIRHGEAQGGARSHRGGPRPCRRRSRRGGTEDAAAARRERRLERGDGAQCPAPPRPSGCGALRAAGRGRGGPQEASRRDADRDRSRRIGTARERRTVRCGRCGGAQADGSRRPPARAALGATRARTRPADRRDDVSGRRNRAARCGAARSRIAGRRPDARRRPRHGKAAGERRVRGPRAAPARSDCAPVDTWTGDAVIECPIARGASLRPAAPALRWRDHTWTYRELDVLVRRWHGALARFGDTILNCANRQRAVVRSENRPEIVALVFAAARAGIEVALLNARLAEAELPPLLDQLGPALHLGELPGASPLADFASDARALEPAPIDPARVQTILFTSGTTGRPKAAQLTAGAHVANARASIETLRIDSGSTYLCNLPLFHVGGIATVWRWAPP